MTKKELKAATVKHVVGVYPRGSERVLALSVDDGQEIGLTFDTATALDAISRLLSALPRVEDEELVIEAAPNLKPHVSIDRVAVSKDQDDPASPYVVEFRAAGKNVVKISMPHEEAVRWMLRLRSHIAARAKKHAN